MTDPSRDHPAWRPFRRRLLEMVFATPFYGPTLLNRQPGGLSAAPPDPWPGSVENGASMLEGTYSFAGTTIHPDDSPWDETDAEEEWLATLHSFQWLRDLRAVGGDRARRLARKLTEDWLTRNHGWSAEVWRADITGLRLVAWMSHFELFFSSAPDPFRSRLLAQMTRQARHLARTAQGEVDGLARLEAIKGLLYSGLCLPGESGLLTRANRLLAIELARQIFPDGSHVERSPASQYHLLCDLVDMRAAFGAGRQNIPPALSDAIERAAPMLRFFRHGDGKLALFNDTGEGDASAIDLALAQANIRKRVPPMAPESRFERLSAGKLLALIDTGTPPPAAWNARTHAGTLGLEISFGKERLVVHCGPAAAPGIEWHDAARATAAHSTLTIEDTNSSERNGNQRLYRTHSDRKEADGNIWLDSSHDGYGVPFGLIHHRRLYVSARGDEMRGEDKLAPTGTSQSGAMHENRAFAIRFHFHPAVRASMVQNGGAILLRLPGGTGWRLRAAGAKIDLAESIYFGSGGAKRTQQAVLSGRTDGDGATVKWALRREDANG